MKAERKAIGKPSLRPDDIGTATAVVVTVTGVDYRASKYGDKRYVLQLKEFPDKELWLSATESNLLIDNIGDDTENWLGARIPLVRETLDVRGKSYEALQVPEDFEGVLKTFAKRTSKKA